MRQGAINWMDVRKRLRESEIALQEALSGSPARTARVLRQRAAQLARASSKPLSQGVPALLFRLAHGRYAIRLTELSEVLPFRNCTAVPASVPRVLGVVNLRGQLRPVIDLSLVLEQDRANDSGFVLMLRREIGLKVDAIEDIGEVHLEELEGPVAPGSFLQGFKSGTLLLIDTEAFVSRLSQRNYDK